MTALFMDGYVQYGTGSGSVGNMLAGPYAQVSNVIVSTASWDASQTPCIKNSGGDASGARTVVATPGTHFFVSFRYAADTLSPSPAFPIVFLDGGAAPIVSLNFTSTGAAQLLAGAGNQINPGAYTVIAQTSGPVIVAENFHFLEMEINTSAHTFKLRVDDADATETPILSVTDSRITGTIAQMTYEYTGSTGGVGRPSAYMTDIFVRDSSGTVNNSWLGDRKIGTLFMDSDTSTSGWTPSYYKKFGSGIYNSGGSGFMTAAASTALDFGSSDFTVEGFFRLYSLPSATGYATIMSRWDSANNHRSWRLVYGGSTFNSNCLQFDISTDGTGGTQQTMIAYPWSPNVNQWYHIALVRSSGQLLLFVNGKQFGLPITDANTYYSSGAEVLGIGGEVQGTSSLVSLSNFVGWMDETRVTNGVARYTGPFTAPSSAFPRGGGSDPDWSQVVLLLGYNGNFADESSYVRTVTARSTASTFSPTDGPTVGAYSTVNKATPDDNTFITAAYEYASNILTMTTQPSNGDTVTVGTKDGVTAAVYTFKNAISSAFDVLIDTTAQNTLLNLQNAINLGTGIGTKYGTGTTANFDVIATSLPAGQFEVVAYVAGTAGNSIASTTTGSAASWATATLTGGVNLPGPTQFLFQRPDPKTTIISAVQLTYRALKTDAGTATVQAGLVGPLGGVNHGPTHNLTVSPVYYRDIVETDPDTSGPITPTTLINGRFEINRTA